MPDTITTFSLVLGALGSVFFIASCFSINRKHILVLGIASSVMLILGYIAKSDITAATMLICALTRNALFLAEDTIAHPKFTRRTVGWIMLPLVFAFWSVAEWGNFHLVSLLILLGPLLLTVGFILPSITGLKILTILNGISWLVYEFLTGAYTVMLGESVGLCVSAIALYRVTHPQK